MGAGDPSGDPRPPLQGFGVHERPGRKTSPWDRNPPAGPHYRNKLDTSSPKPAVLDRIYDDGCTAIRRDPIPSIENHISGAQALSGLVVDAGRWPQASSVRSSKHPPEGGHYTQSKIPTYAICPTLGVPMAMLNIHNGHRYGTL